MILLEIAKKRGPKTDNPKLYKIGVKIDQECKDILDYFAETEGLGISEVVRKGIKLMKPPEKK